MWVLSHPENTHPLTVLAHHFSQRQLTYLDPGYLPTLPIYPSLYYTAVTPKRGVPLYPPP